MIRTSVFPLRRKGLKIVPRSRVRVTVKNTVTPISLFQPSLTSALLISYERPTFRSPRRGPRRLMSSTILVVSIFMNTHRVVRC
ncbi:hypothetical protein BDZ94DRAFT_402381 [Collybia nuda]|uniref:Uncharacterized protein n=1 Tax=Collybia nuda TaxID=64659 RepID=A0A9P6CCR1_9AGAR|nr:hypothetical protein BDZ94DRAFT_402381 [Collybia nuda]